MPRIYDRASDPHDFCVGCMPDESDAIADFEINPDLGDGPDGRGNCFSYKADHPPYPGDNDMYRCEAREKHLTEEDD